MSRGEKGWDVNVREGGEGEERRERKGTENDTNLSMEAHWKHR